MNEALKWAIYMVPAGVLLLAGVLSLLSPFALEKAVGACAILIGLALPSWTFNLFHRWVSIVSNGTTLFGSCLLVVGAVVMLVLGPRWIIQQLKIRYRRKHIRLVR